MTHLASSSFAKKLLVISLSAVFSEVAMANSDASGPNLGQIFVTINNVQQTSPNENNNPLSNDQAWWGVQSDSQGNTVEVSIAEGTGDVILVTEDIIGGWKSSGEILTNHISIQGKTPNAISLYGRTVAGFSDIASDVTIQGNSVDVSGVSIKNQQRMTFLRPFLIAGAMAVSNDDQNDSYDISVTGNTVNIRDSELYEGVVVGGWIDGNEFITKGYANDNQVNLVNLGYIPPNNAKAQVLGGMVTGGVETQANRNQVSISLSNVQTVVGGRSTGQSSQANGNKVNLTETFASTIYGSLASGNQAQANGNEVILTETDASTIYASSASGYQAQASNNVVEFINVSARYVVGVRVIGDALDSFETTSKGFAKATDNRFIWENTNDENIPLEDLRLVTVQSESQVEISGNHGEFIGVNAVAEEGSIIDPRAFEVLAGESGTVLVKDNTLKLHQSNFSGFGGLLASGGTIDVVGNHMEVIGKDAGNLSSLSILSGFEVSSSGAVEIADNTFKAEYIKSDKLNPIISTGGGTVGVSQNKIFIDNSNVNNLSPVYIQGADIDISGNVIAIDRSLLNSTDGITNWTGSESAHVNISGNQISISNSRWDGYDFEESSNSSVTYGQQVKFVKSNVTESVSIQNNTFEFVGNEITDNKGLGELIGVSLVGNDQVKSIEIANNTLLVKDSQVGEVIGVELDGFVSSETQMNFNNNTIILDNATVNDGVHSVLSLGVRSALPQQGQLVLRRQNSAASVNGFDTLQFDLDTAEANQAMLTLTRAGDVVLENQTWVLNNANEDSVVDKVLVATNELDASLKAENVTLRTEGTFAFKALEIEGELTGNVFRVDDYYQDLISQKTRTSESTRTLADSQLATVALTRQTSEEALNLLQSTENLSADAPMKGFASLSGSSNFYELGTGFDLNSTSLTVGGALRINDKWSGVGFANFSVANADSTVSGFRGDSDMKTYSAGVALRYQTEMPFYTEGAVVVGQADTDFVGYYTNDTARYDSKRFYTTAQLGVGSDFALSDNVNLNVYGRYSFTYLDGDKVSLNNTYNDTFDVDDTMVHAMRVGARVKGSVAPNVQWFAGAVFERVLDGDVESMVKDAKLKTETLKGNVGIFEVGATLAPNDLGPWTMDVKAGAYAGDRRGVSGSVSVNYVF